jgi:(p)ppGpp synthase/HD superfamily hydrolase
VMNLVDKAVMLTLGRTYDMVRWPSRAPYLAHLLSCAQIVGAYGGTSRTRTAAILHDAIEDLGIAYSDIVTDFGEQVAQLVWRVTEDKGQPWQTRKKRTIDMAQTCDQETAIVILADKIDTTHAMLREIPEKREAFTLYWAQFNAGYHDQVWFLDALMTAFRANTRVIQETEVPELHTFRAVKELERLWQQMLTDVNPS